MKAHIVYRSAAHGTGLSQVFPGFMPLKVAQKICANSPNHTFVKLK